MHHVVPIFNFPDRTKAHVLTNLLCLCQKCHNAVEPGFVKRGERLKRLVAEARAWSELVRGRQTQLADLLDVSQSSVSAWLPKTSLKQTTDRRASPGNPRVFSETGAEIMSETSELNSWEWLRTNTRNCLNHASRMGFVRLSAIGSTWITALNCKHS